MNILDEKDRRKGMGEGLEEPVLSIDCMCVESRRGAGGGVGERERVEWPR